MVNESPIGIPSPVVGLILFLLLFPGCVNLPSGPEWPPSGLGIDVPPMLPRVGPFLEPAEDLKILEDFLRSEGPLILEECGNPDGMGNVIWHLDRWLHGDAIEQLIWACKENVIAKRGPLAKRAIEDGSEREVFDEWHEKAQVALEELRVAINDHPGPGNVVEAQLLDRLMRRYIVRTMGLNVWGPDFMETYETDYREEVVLTSAYLNILGGLGEPPAIHMILERYPWSGGTCSPPEVDLLVDRIESKTNETIALAEYQLNNTGYEGGNHYAFLVGLDVFAFEVARDEGWWIRLLVSDVRMTNNHAYWENLSAPAWPTEQEARYLIAEYRSHTRTIWTEHFLDQEPFWHYFKDPDSAWPGYDWSVDYGGGPPRVMAMLVTKWPFAGLECT